jgi:hypothetical protein
MGGQANQQTQWKYAAPANLSKTLRQYTPIKKISKHTLSKYTGPNEKLS